MNYISPYATNTMVMATIGPTLETQEDINRAIDAGAHWFRLPIGYRFRDHVSHAQLVKNAANGRQVQLLFDLPSERLRVGTIEDTPLSVGTELWMSDPSNEMQLRDGVHPCPIPGLGKFLACISNGCAVSLLDGRIGLRVVEVSATGILVQVIEGQGTLKSSNAVVFPGGEVVPALIGEDDRVILRKAIDGNVLPDWVALSMVASGSQLAAARAELSSLLGTDVKIMAKIETAAALQDRELIIAESDGVMIARGDLGQIVDVAMLPDIQRTWVAATRMAGKPVIVATQFLECFAESGFPQRCELTDLVNAGEQGATAVMLGKETVFSKRPIDAVQLAIRCLRVGNEPRIPSEVFDGDPRKRLGNRRLPPIVAVEGGNGVGKSTALNELLRRNPRRQLRLGVPDQWMRPDMKMRMIRDADWMASALYFLSGTLELSREILEGEDYQNAPTVLLDRCVWSTLAVHAAHDPARLAKLMPVLRSLAGHICVPEKTVVLTASLETLWKRISEKSADEAAYDLLTQNYDYWSRELGFYKWLQNALSELQIEGVKLEFIATDDLTPHEVVDCIEQILES